MKGTAAEVTQQRGALIACKGLPSGSMPFIRNMNKNLGHKDAVYRICDSLSMRNFGLRTTQKDLLTMIVFRSLGNRPKLHSRHLVLFEKQAGPTSMVFLSNAALKKRAGLFEHGRLLVITEDDTMPIGHVSQWRPRTLKKLRSSYSDETFCRGTIGSSLRRTRYTSTEENNEESSRVPHKHRALAPGW